MLAECRYRRDAHALRHLPKFLEVLAHQWPNLGENVLTPFMGVGSEVAGAVVNGRRGVGIELKPSYYRQSVKNLKQVVEVGGWGGIDDQLTMEKDFAESETTGD